MNYREELNVSVNETLIILTDTKRHEVLCRGNDAQYPLVRCKGKTTAIRRAAIREAGSSRH